MLPMKENHERIFDESTRFRDESDSLFVGNRIYPIIGLRRNDHPSEFEVNDRDEFSNSKCLDEFSMDNGSVSIDSPKKEQHEVFNQQNSLREHADMSSSNRIDRDGNENHESLIMTEELEKETNLYTGKDLLVCGLPELQLCYKEIDQHTLKEICLDQGMPFQPSLLNENIKEDQPDHSFCQRLKCDGHYEATEGGGKVEFIPSDGLPASSFNSIKGIGANEHEVKEESNCKLLAQQRQKLPSGVPGKAKITMAPGDDNVVDGKLSIQEDVQARNLLYKSKVESGSITFNFNSSTPTAATVTNGRTQNIRDRSVESEDVLDRKGIDAKQAQCNNIDVSSIGEVYELFLNVKDGFSNGLSAASNAQSVGSNEMIDENIHSASHDNKNQNSDCLSSQNHLQFASSRSINSISDGQASELHISKHEHRDSGNDSAVNQGKYDMGESSFSAASLIAYSGPTAFSDSLSVHSDSSAATSGRSFAFPILQPEWNSSPVKMTKADDRRFRKHKGWRSGLLCCRF